MQGNRGRDTQPELHVRRAIHAAGLRYRVNVRPLKGLNRTADIVVTRQQIAVFIDGCYWHRCPRYANLGSGAGFDNPAAGEDLSVFGGTVTLHE